MNIREEFDKAYHAWQQDEANEEAEERDAVLWAAEWMAKRCSEKIEQMRTKETAHGAVYTPCHHELGMAVDEIRKLAKEFE